MEICRGGRGVAGHTGIAHEGLTCPWCKDREAMAGKVADLMDELSLYEGRSKNLKRSLTMGGRNDNNL
jgi:hypothetical protein